MVERPRRRSSARRGIGTRSPWRSSTSASATRSRSGRVAPATSGRSGRSAIREANRNPPPKQPCRARPASCLRLGVESAVMDRSSTVRFAHAARRLGAAARAAGLTVPAFRSPPRRPGAPRTIRRLPGGPVVAVVLRDRAFADVLADMVEGIVIANRLAGSGRRRGSGARCSTRSRARPRTRGSSAAA